MNLKMTKEPGVLVVTASGTFSLAEAEQDFFKVLAEMAQHRICKLLFDGRGVGGDPLLIERFLYGEFAARTVADYCARKECPSTPCFAYVLHCPLRDPTCFGETTALNRGMLVKTFVDMDEGREWLGQCE
jgi:hypothetical protein